MLSSRFLSPVVLALLLSAAGSSATLASPLADRDHHGHRGGHRGSADAPVVIVPSGPGLGTGAFPSVQNAPVLVPVPVPVPVPVSSAPNLPGVGPNALSIVPPGFPSPALPALQQWLPPDAFQQAPLRFVPLPDSRYALSHPLLFCGLDSAGLCETMAEQLAEVAPGFGTAVLDGPDGYGMYLTYRRVA